MEHSSYIDYLKDLATRSTAIRHDQPIEGSSLRRVSFFRMNNEQEMQQAIGTQADFPAMCVPAYSGRLADEGNGVVRDVMEAGFEIRTHVADALDFAAIEAARDECKRIGRKIIARMKQQAEDDACPIVDFDIAPVRYDFTGPINVNEYGCRFSFPITDPDYNALTEDLSADFI